MNLSYGGVALDAIGRVQILSESSQGEPAEAPQRWLKTLKVRLNFHEASYADNRALVEAVRTALRTQQAVLIWQDPDTLTTFLNQTVNLVEHDLPEDPNKWGTFYQAITLTFTYYDTALAPQTLGATYQRSGVSTPVLSLGQVVKFRDDYRSKRFSEMRGQRQIDAGSVTLGGAFVGNPLADLATRRGELLATKDQWMTELKSGMEGTLAYGTFSQVVRVADFTADVDQATSMIHWTLSATFTRWPDETNYARAEFGVTTREDKDTGVVTLSFSGTIDADSEASARAKLAALRTSLVAAAYIPLKQESDAHQVDADTDGQTFLSLSFTEEYQKSNAHILDYRLRTANVVDAATGLNRVNYSGSVTAAAGDYASAYAAATAKAAALGDNQYQFKVHSQVTASDSQRLTASGASPTTFIVHVEFDYEYLAKGTRLYLELESRIDTPMFGEWRERVSGFIVAADEATLDSQYAALFTTNSSTGAAYNTLLVRDEQHSKSKVKIGNVNLTTGAAVGGTTDLLRRLDFSFDVHVDRPGSQTAFRYEFAVETDYVTRERRASVEGTCWASAGPSPTDTGAQIGASVAEAAITSFTAGLSLGKRLSSRRVASREQAPTKLGAGLDVFVAMTFTEHFVDVVTGAAGIIQCSVREEIEAGGPRLVVQPTAVSTDVVQTCGTQSAKRTVSGTVTATTEAICVDWISRQRSLPLYGDTAARTAPYAYPPRVTFESAFIPLTDGTARGETVNAKFVTATFSFAEVLPDYSGPL